MNITYFIGNGFDLQLGLHTSYYDFYNYLKNCNSEIIYTIDSYYYKKNEKIKYNLNLSSVEDKIKNLLWRDLELTLGKMTTDFNSANQFIDFYKSVVLKLQQFIKEENEYINPSIPIEFKSGIDSILKRFKTLELQRFYNIIDENSLKANIYSFVSFNYSLSVKNFIEQVKKTRGNYNLPLYVHGSIAEADNVIFGVNDNSQIKNQFIAQDIKMLLIKSESLMGYESDVISSVNKIISKSQIICLYGVSLGETDKNYWISIIKWLLQDEKHIVIMFEYNKSILQQRFPDDFQTLKKQTVKKLLKFYQPSNDVKLEKLENQVFVQFVDDKDNLLKKTVKREVVINT